MITIENFKEYVAYQEQKEGDKVSEDGLPLVLYLQYEASETTEPGRYRLSINSQPVLCN